MDTPYLDEQINELEIHLRNDDLSMLGKEELIEFKDIKQQLALCDVGCSFLKDLIKKEETLQKQLSKNLDSYKERDNMVEYDKTFSQWNKCNLVLWDLKDVLCRMGIDID